MSKTLCKFAWGGMTSTMINTFRPCCRFPLDDNQQYPTTDQLINQGSQALNNTFLKKLRRDMLDGIPRSECEKCYVEEQSDQLSMRQKANALLTSQIESDNFDKLEFLEISLDNLCNLECRICSSAFSSKLRYRDAFLKQMGLENYYPSKAQYKTIELMDVLDLDNLRMIKMLGGEPLISPNLLKFLQRIPNPAKVDLLIITNGTTFPNSHILDKLLEFKSVRFDFSIDGIFDYNNYQRVGSNFTHIMNNAMNLYKIIPQQHSIHSVYSSLNIFGLDESVRWFIDNTPFRTSIDLVRDHILSPFVTPKWYVDKILLTLSETNPYKDLVFGMFAKWHNFEESKWHQLLSFCKHTDSLYNTDIRKINPILSEQLTKYT